MRWKFSILLALPVANALSLANFQSISIPSIPLICQLTYDGQIPSCQVSDFNTGCTVACVAGLNSIAADVIRACDGTHVTASSLLGIIQAGGIQGALCPTLAKVSTSTKAKTTYAVIASTVSPALSVTLPTDGAGVTGGLGFKTSSTSSAATVKATTTRASSTISVTVKSSQTAQSTATADSSTGSSSSSIESAAESGVQTTFSTTTSATNKGSVQTSSSIAQTTTKAASNNGVSGGGSPFDIQSSAHRVGGQSMLGFIIFAAWAGILLGR